MRADDRQMFKELKPGDVFYVLHCEGYSYRKIDRAFCEDSAGFVYFTIPETCVVTMKGEADGR